MDKALQKKLSSAVRKARVALGLTQEDAAEQIGVSVEFYSRIERGSALPSLKTFIRMAVAFGVSTDRLIGLSGDDGALAIEGYKAQPPDDPPELRRLIRRLRKSSAGLWKIVDLIVKELEKRFAQSENRSENRIERSGEAKRGTGATKPGRGKKGKKPLPRARARRSKKKPPDDE